MIWRVTWCRWNVRLALVAHDHVDIPFEDCCSRGAAVTLAAAREISCSFSLESLTVWYFRNEEPSHRPEARAWVRHGYGCTFRIFFTWYVLTTPLQHLVQPYVFQTRYVFGFLSPVRFHYGLYSFPGTRVQRYSCLVRFES